MDYTEYFLEQSLHGDGPPLTGHGPTTPTKEQAKRRATRRDNYRAVVMIDVKMYLAELAEDEVG